MIDFPLDCAPDKETSEINARLNTYTGVVVSEADLMEAVYSDVRKMSLRQLALVHGPFSVDMRIELRKRKIEQLHSSPEKGLFPVIVRMRRGVEIPTPMSGVFKAKATFTSPSSFVYA